MKVKGYTVLADGRKRAHLKVNRGPEGRALQKVHTFPADTSDDVIAAWRATQKVELKKKKIVRGSLAEDIDRYLKLRSSMPSFTDRKRELSMWLPRFGQRSRHSITSAEITDQINAWLTTDKRPTTISHWRSALSNLYRTLDGRSGPNPVRDALRPPTVKAINRAIPFSTARAIVRRMEENGAKKRGNASAIRAKILLNTGMRVGELMRLTPTMVQRDGDNPFVSVPASKGGNSRRVPLNVEAVAAFKAFQALALYGKFSVGSLRKSLHAACKALMVDCVHPHVLRHSFSDWLVNAGGVSLRTAGYLLGHKSLTTTLRYVRTSHDQAREAMKALDLLVARNAEEEPASPASSHS